MEVFVLAAWEVPIVLAAAFLGANRWLDNRLKECEEEETRQHEADKRCQMLAEGVVPDLYQFYQEMDGVIERIGSKDAARRFCEDMDKLIEFMCVCKEPEGNPTVQNLMMMAMAGKNCGLEKESSSGSQDAVDVFVEHLLGEIRRTSPSKSQTEKALEASANIINTMFPDRVSELSIYTDRKVRGW
jgi:hypothetical protein